MWATESGWGGGEPGGGTHVPNCHNLVQCQLMRVPTAPTVLRLSASVFACPWTAIHEQQAGLTHCPSGVPLSWAHVGKSAGDLAATGLARQHQRPDLASLLSHLPPRHRLFPLSPSGFPHRTVRVWEGLCSTRPTDATHLPVVMNDKTVVPTL